MGSVRFRIDELRSQDPPRPFVDNGEAVDAWDDWARKRLKERTREQYGSQIQLFLDAFGDILVTDLGVDDVRHYLDKYEAHGCTHFKPARLSNQQDRCAASCPLETCPVLHAYGVCVKQQPREPGTTLHHLNALHHFFRFLKAQRQIPENPIPDIRREWQAENAHRMRPRAQRTYSKLEVKAMLRAGLPPYVKFLFVLLLKTGLRISEALALRTDPDLLNVSEGWLRVPCIGEKRCGGQTPCTGTKNHFVVIDAELDFHLRKYLRWRKNQLKTIGDTTQLLVGPLTRTPSYNTVYRHWAKPAMAKLGIQIEGTATQRVFHAFRHTFTTTIRSNGCDDGWTEVLRGCSPPGNLATYHHPSVEDIQRVYAQWGPRLDDE